MREACGDWTWKGLTVGDRPGLPQSCKKVDYVAPEEIRAAILQVVNDSFGATPIETADGAPSARIRTRHTDDARAIIDQNRDALVAAGVLEQKGESLIAASKGNNREGSRDCLGPTAGYARCYNVPYNTLSESCNMETRLTKKTVSASGLDPQDPIEAHLIQCASRIGRLLAVPAVNANPDVESSLDDFLGAIYALIRAKKKNFQDRPGRRINRKPVAQRAARIAAGHVKTDGLWIAGFYFNNALFRTAAVYHRVLQVVTGMNNNVPALQTAAIAAYPGWNSIRLYRFRRRSTN